MGNESLTHHGIRGMRWGVRRTPAQLGKASTKSSSKTNSKKTNVKSMSDDELRKKVSRLQLEKQYSQLSSSEVNRGRAAAQRILKTATTAAAVTTTALTLYNNAGKIRDIINKIKT